MKAIKNDYDTNVMYDTVKVAGKLQISVSHHPIDLSMVLVPNDVWFLESKREWGGRGVKGKNTNVSNIEAVKEKDLNDEPVAMEVQSPLVDQTNAVKTGGGSYLSLPTQGTTPAKNTLGNSSYANVTEDVGNVPVWVKLHGVPITAFSEDGLSAITMKLGTPLMLDSYTSDVCLQSWDMSSYARVMIELRADMELKDNIMVAMPKIMAEGPVPKEPTSSPSGNKNKGVAHTNEVSNSNPFDVLNSVDNDVEFGTNGGNTNLVNNGANSSVSSFINVENSSTSYTPIVDKFGKFKYLLIDGKAILVDEAGNPLKKVEFLGDYDSEDEVAPVIMIWLVLWLQNG
ncbi:proteasome subunit alpha type-5 [Tanacetum coccineum]